MAEYSALTVALFASFSTVLQATSGILGICTFLKVRADELLETPDNTTTTLSETPLSIWDTFCGDPVYEVDGDIMWLMSRYFLVASLGVAVAALALAWSLAICVEPTVRKWRTMAFLFILACVLQMPVFLIFESYPCSDFKPEQTCEFGVGSYLLMGSIAGWVFTVLLTQCLDLPYEKDAPARGRSPSLDDSYAVRSLRSDDRSRSSSYASRSLRSGRAPPRSAESASTQSLRQEQKSVNVSDAFDLTKAYYFEEHEEKKDDNAFDPFGSDRGSPPRSMDQRSLVSDRSPGASHRSPGAVSEKSPISSGKESSSSRPPLAAGLFRQNVKPNITRGYMALEGNTPPRSVASGEDKSIQFSSGAEEVHVARDDTEKRLLQSWTALHNIGAPIIRVQSTPYDSDEDGPSTVYRNEEEEFLSRLQSHSRPIPAISRPPQVPRNISPGLIPIYNGPAVSVASRSSASVNSSPNRVPFENSSQVSKEKGESAPNEDEERDVYRTPSQSMKRGNSVPNLAQYSGLNPQANVAVNLGGGSGIHNIHRVENYRSDQARSFDSEESEKKSPARVTPKTSNWREEKTFRAGIHAKIDHSMSMSSDVSDLPPASNQLRQARIQRMLRDKKMNNIRSKSAEPPRTGRLRPPRPAAMTPPRTDLAPRRVHVVSPGEEKYSPITRTVSHDNSSVSSLYTATRSNAFRTQPLGGYSFSFSFDRADGGGSHTFNKLWKEDESDVILNDLDVSLAHLRRPIASEYGVDEVSL